MKLSHFVGAAALLASSAAGAIGPCYQEPGTRAMTCIDGTKVRSNGDIRSSFLFTGGPNGVEQLPYKIIADCKRKVTTLQDQKGVNFGGGLFDSTPVNKSLSESLCAAKKTIPDKKLAQF